MTSLHSILVCFIFNVFVDSVRRGICGIVFGDSIVFRLGVVDGSEPEFCIKASLHALFLPAEINKSIILICSLI